MATQLCRVPSASRVEYVPREILAGPHEWEFGGHVFKTVLVRAPDNKPRELSCILAATGHRICKVPEVRAPKTRAHDALFRTSEALQALEVKVGTAEMVKRISTAEPLPAHIIEQHNERAG